MKCVGPKKVGRAIELTQMTIMGGKLQLQQMHTHTLSQLNFVEKEKLIDFKWGKIKQHAAASSCHCAKCVIKFRLEFSINSATWYNKYAITIIYWQSNRIWFLAKTCEKRP